MTTRCSCSLFISTITTWGKEGEVEAFRNMLEKFPSGLVACVSDSYDIWNACTSIWGSTLKNMIEQRGEKDSLVVRPDSGDPPEVVVKVLHFHNLEFLAINPFLNHKF